MLHFDIDPRITCKPSKLIAHPRFIRVNEFTEDSVTRFRLELEAACVTGQPVIPVVIDSSGGEIYALMSMIDALNAARRHAKIATVAEGKAMSAGSVLLTCGDEGFRFVAPNATVMIHDASDVAFGKTHDLKSSVRETERLDKAAYRLMDRNCGQQEGYFEALVHNRAHADWYLSPQEAVRHNLANDIGVPEMAVIVSVDYMFGVPQEEKPKKKRGKK